MEAMKMRLFVAVMVVLMAVQNVAAQVEAPAPSPVSDAALFVPAVFASFAALFFGLLF
ncbi:arabinogalactan protein 12-like [Mercurialis annua]|uniref:arabinogalactan protein 12-like n=1 Tax=Mercurialis annua TaxID=3986 RepID=UPI0021603A12|nr:arabinogalactan protein 12-like [Mercurialis annua]